MSVRAARCVNSEHVHFPQKSNGGRALRGVASWEHGRGLAPFASVFRATCRRVGHLKKEMSIILFV